MREDAAGVFDQDSQELELVGGEVDRLPIAAHLAAGEVDVEGAQLEDRVAGGGVGGGAVAQGDADAGEELADAEGLGEIIVRAKVEALDSGADDYLTKPFSVGELLARVRVALRHRAAANTATGDPVFELGPLHIDLARREVRRDRQPVHLTPNEFKLLAVLVKNAGRVLTHQQLLRQVWGPGSGNETHYLRVYMNQLRQKLEPDAARPKHLLTEPGVGYRLVES